jgi:hypothetical protein
VTSGPHAGSSSRRSYALPISRGGIMQCVKSDFSRTDICQAFIRLRMMSEAYLLPFWVRTLTGCTVPGPGRDGFLSAFSRNVYLFALLSKAADMPRIISRLTVLRLRQSSPVGIPTECFPGFNGHLSNLFISASP